MKVTSPREILSASRTLLAIVSAKSAARACALLGRGGTSLPGLVALRLDPSLVRHLGAQLGHGCLVVAGTNGKTTTSTLIAAAFIRARRPIVHNRAGSNMLRGIAATLALQTTIAGRLRRGRRLTGLFELDEAALPNIVAQVQPRIIVVTNLFRDQLDRYGELQAIADHWRTAIHQLPSSVLVVLNADDPLVANLATAAPGPVLFFGIDQWGTALTDAAVRPTFSADSVYCPRCGASLHFAQISYAHLGHYYCPACDFRRPTPDVVATAVTVGPDYSNFTVTIGATTIPCHVPLPGRYNAYNALAALSAAYVTRIPLPVAITAIGAAKGAFGRAETVQAQGRTVRLFLIKNPTGADEVLNVISTAPHDAALLVLLNDNAADGEDVSWIWDVRFDVLATWTGPLRCGGTRADDIALRLKYAGLPKAEVVQPGDLRATVLDAISATPIGHTLYIVATYTAMLAARDAMARQGYVAQYWQDSA